MIFGHVINVVWASFWAGLCGVCLYFIVPLCVDISPEILQDLCLAFAIVIFVAVWFLNRVDILRFIDRFQKREELPLKSNSFAFSDKKKLAFLFIYDIFKPHLSRDDSAFLFGMYDEQCQLGFYPLCPAKHREMKGNMS